LRSHALESNEKLIVFGSPKIGKKEIDEVIHSLESGWLGSGPKVAKFESDFAVYKDVSSENVTAVNSCTAALHIAMLSAGIRDGDEVITTPMTFCATVNSIIHAGARPVLADIDPESLNIDPDQIENHITDKTKAMVVVHFAGRPCDMDRITHIADKYNILVIEDCAHAIESEYCGKKTGTIGQFGCFSFYVTKNVVTGEGGMVISQEKEKSDLIRVLSLHGMDKDAWHRFSDDGYKHYHVTQCGFKYNMMDLQAAIGIHQLSHVEINWKRRQDIWNLYQEAFSDLPVKCPKQPDNHMRHAYHLFTLMIDPQQLNICRDEFLNQMALKNIGLGVHYLSIPEHPYYQNSFGWKPEMFPNAMKVGRQTVSLPLSPKLTNDEVQRIINAVRNVVC